MCGAASGGETTETLPVLGVRPINGELKWYFDAEACGRAGGNGSLE